MHSKEWLQEECQDPLFLIPSSFTRSDQPYYYCFRDVASKKFQVDDNFTGLSEYFHHLYKPHTPPLPTYSHNPQIPAARTKRYHFTTLVKFNYTKVPTEPIKAIHDKISKARLPQWKIEKVKNVSVGLLGGWLEMVSMFIIYIPIIITTTTTSSPTPPQNLWPNGRPSVTRRYGPQQLCMQRSDPRWLGMTSRFISASYSSSSIMLENLIIWTFELMTVIKTNNIDNISTTNTQLMLPALAYYCLDGPWRSMWVCFGYDCKNKKESKIYQNLDFRLEKGRLLLTAFNYSIKIFFGICMAGLVALYTGTSTFRRTNNNVKINSKVKVP